MKPRCFFFFRARIEHFNNRLSWVPEMKACVYIMDVSEELLWCCIGGYELSALPASSPPPKKKKNALSKLSEDHLFIMCAQKRKMSESYVYQEEEAGRDL